MLVAEGADAMPCFSRAINAVPAGVAPATKPGAGTFTYLGCYSDSAQARSLAAGSRTAANMTVEECVRLAQGFQYAGVEYST